MDSDRLADDPAPCCGRRALLTGAATSAGVGVVTALGGCATYGGSSNKPAGGAASAAGGSNSAAGGGGKVLAQTADIPVGGGKVFSAESVVVTQPEQGTIKAFSAICTHQGCTVGSVSGGTINCPCHGSKYKIADGSVANGPATRALSAVKITVEGGAIKLG
jgi:Rieske Fe-S protein